MGCGRAFWSALLPFAVILGGGSCSKKTEAERVAPSPLYQSILDSASGFSISELLAGAKFQNCDDVEEVLRGLDARLAKASLPSVALFALLRELLHYSRAQCSSEMLRKTLSGKGVASSLVVSMVAADPALALSALQGRGEVAILRRRGELLFGMNRPEEALADLLLALEEEDTDAQRARASRLLSQMGRPAAGLTLCSKNTSSECLRARFVAWTKMGAREEALRGFSSLALHLKMEVAQDMVAGWPDWRGLLNEKMPSELLVAMAERAGREPETAQNLKLAWEAYQRAYVASPEDADIAMAYAESCERMGKLVEAVAAWDAAASIATASVRPVLASIRILAEKGKGAQALARADRLAHGAKTAQSLHLASLGYKYAKAPRKAVDMASLALAARPQDGRLWSELASRWQEAGEPKRAEKVLRTLLVCGVAGSAWHRHDLLARLQALDSDAFSKTSEQAPLVRELLASQSCTPVDLPGLKAAVMSGPQQ